MLRRDKNLVLFIAFILLGIITSVQFRSTLQARKKDTKVEKTIETYAEQLQNEIKLGELLIAELNEITAAYNEKSEKYIQASNDEELIKEWRQVRLKAGLTAVKGKGIVITLDDAPARSEDVDPSMQIIHDMDIKIIVNELKKAGAQAISINGERITPISEMVCGGPTILINRNRYSVPYVIQAIGDPDLMYDMIIYNERVALMKEYNIRVDMKKQAELTIPGFKPELIDKDGMSKLISGLEVLSNEAQ